MYFANSIKLGIVAEDEDHLFKAYIAWGKALIHYGKHEESLAELSQAMDIAEHLGDFHNLRSILSSLTDALTRLGRHSEVIEYYDRAIVATQNHPALIEQRESFVRSLSSSKKPVLKKEIDLDRTLS